MKQQQYCPRMSLEPYAMVYGMCGIKASQVKSLYDKVGCDFLFKHNWKECKLLKEVYDDSQITRPKNPS